jgi:hypothetical protein
MNSDSQLEALHQMTDILSSKESYYLTFTLDKTVQSTRFLNPIKLNQNRRYECALQYLGTSNYLINITEKNNMFYYKYENIYYTILFEKGAYEISDIGAEIKRVMTLRNHYSEKEPSFILSTKNETFKSVIEIKSDKLSIDFKQPNTFRNILGFEPKILNKGYHVSDNTIQITSSSSIMINCDLISGSYHNGVEKNILHSFPAMLVPSGYRMNIFNSNLLYLPVNKSVIDNIMFKITDDNFEVVDLKGEKISLGIHIRQI